MTPVDLLNHSLNFVLPALWVAVLMPLMSRIVTHRKQHFALSLWLQMGANFVVNLLLLGFGLGFFGHDGKMIVYTGMLLVCGTVQWLIVRGWK